MHKAIKYLFNQKIRLLKHKYQSYEYFSVAMETKTIFFHEFIKFEVLSFK